MARRKSKKPQQLDTPMLSDSSVTLGQYRGTINTSASPALLFVIIFAAGASVMGFFCVQQQHSLDQLATSFTAMQTRIANLQQVMETTDAQTDAGSDVEERIFALEEAQKQAQERAEVALATSEKLMNSDLYSQLLTLQNEMDTRLAEMKQVSLSVTTLQAMFKNQSEEFEAIKESIVAGLGSSSTLVENVAGLTDAVANAYSGADEQVASVEALAAQLEGQASKLSELKESMHLQGAALYTKNQETAAIKELVEAKQAMRAQALEEMLSSVQRTLDEQFVMSQTLHSSVTAQLQTFHTQLANGPSWSMKSNVAVPGGAAPAEILSTTTQTNTEVQEKLEDVDEMTEQQGGEDAAEEEAKDEEGMQEEHTLKQEVEGNLIEGLGEEEITEQEEEMIDKKEEITEDEEEITEDEEETTEEEEEITEDEGQITEEEEEEDITEEEEELTEEEEEITEDEEEVTEEEEEITEEEEKIVQGDQRDEEIPGQSDQQEAVGEAAEEEVSEETTDDHVFDESFEEDAPDEGVESWQTTEDKSSQLNSEVFMDENEEHE